MVPTIDFSHRTGKKLEPYKTSSFTFTLTLIYIIKHITGYCFLHLSRLTRNPTVSNVLDSYWHDTSLNLNSGSIICQDHLRSMDLSSFTIVYNRVRWCFTVFQGHQN